MFHSKRPNACNGRALRITYEDKTSSFCEPLGKDNSVSIHHKNLQALAMEICKISNMSPTILNDIFTPRATAYNLRNPVSFKMQKVHSVYNSTETIFHSGPRIWSLVPHDIKQSVSLGDFKSKNGIHLIVSADYAKIFTSSRIHLRRLKLTNSATVSAFIVPIYYKLVLKCKKFIRSIIVLKLYPI